MNRKEKYQIALTLELIHKLIFAMNYIPTYFYSLLSIGQVILFEI